MQISTLLHEGLIRLPLKADTAEGAIHELVGLVEEAGLIQDSETVAAAVIDRERMHPTGIGHAVAIPHARIAGISEVIIAAGVKTPGIDFRARDGEPARVIFLLLAPEDDTTLYLQTLSSLAMLVMLGELGDRLPRAKHSRDFIEEFRRGEEL